MFLYVQFPSWISPYVIKGLPVRWYALMYIVAFLIAYILFNYQVRHDKHLEIEKNAVDDVFFWGIIGLLLGARIGSCLFYNDAVYYLTHSWMIFWPFEGKHFVGLPGMSYHGGVIGLVLAVLIYAKKEKKSFLAIADYLAAAIPLGYAFGRLGNFINGELYGRVTTSKLGMIFPDATPFSTTYNWVREIADKLALGYSYGGYINLPRHPSQLYELAGEGILLFIILFFVIRPLKYKKNWANGVVMAFYFIFYGIIRFIIEYFRQPDSDIGYVIALGKESNNIALFQSPLNISKGQCFCFLMVIAGIAMLIVFAKMGNKDDRRESKRAKTRA